MGAGAAVWVFVLAANSPRFFGGLDTSSARWARVDIAHCWTQDSVLDTELFPTNVTVVDIPRRYRRSDDTIAKRARVDVLLRLLVGY